MEPVISITASPNFKKLRLTMTHDITNMTSEGLIDQQVFRQREESMRELLIKKPKSAKVMSQLSSLLAANNNESKEALALANQAIQLQPQKPYGYAALSTIETDIGKRMSNLETAMLLSKESHPIAYIGLAIRRLVEPREEEAKRIRGKIGKASQSHPNRRILNEQEETLYKELDKEIEKIRQKYQILSTEERQFLSKTEYKLGLFFRKKEPSTRQIPRAKNHLQNSCALLHSENSEMAEFWLATLDTDNTTTTKCPPSYIVNLYSTFAERFDELLVEKLGYQTPTKLRNLLDSSFKTKFDKGMDLGCGTGLSGLSFCDIVNVLHGVDLSPEMIQKAKERNCYANIQLNDVVHALQDDIIYDIVIACDVFCYIGDLNEVFGAVYQSLSPEGLFCFSTEHLQESEEECAYKLHWCARFSHKESYIRNLASQVGFGIVSLQITSLRKNKGESVTGILAICKKE